MKAFFASWPRKAGLAAIGLALVFVVGLSRSLWFCDIVHVQTGQFTVYDFASVDCSLVWMEFDGRNAKWVPKTPIIERLPAFGINERLEACNVIRHFRFCGFQSVVFSDPGLNGPVYTGWIIPYWAIVLSLTVLAGWLILAPVRPSKPARPDRFNAGQDNPLPQFDFTELTKAVKKRRGLVK